jgi:protein subunit release factor B
MTRTPLISVTANDCDFEYFRGSGNGGQKKQKTSSACRCRHRASGAVGRSEEHREQSANKRLAFKRMTDTKLFRDWIRLESMRRNGTLAMIESYVEQEMKKVRVEVRGEKGWEEIKVLEDNSDE